MTEDNLVERLNYWIDEAHRENEWSDLMDVRYRIEALTAKLAEADAVLELQNRDIARLREAGTKLAGFAAHDIDCEDLTGAYPGSCSCGYASAWKAWSAALEGEQ